METTRTTSRTSPPTRTGASTSWPSSTTWSTPRAAVRLLKAQLARIPHVLTQPAPDVEILSFNPLGPVLAVRPYCHNDHYWQVYFDTNRAIRESFGEAGFPAPEQNVFVRSAG